MSPEDAKMETARGKSRVLASFGNSAGSRFTTNR